ncbi:protein of unknown function [Verrucomicrobium sp. GAS474]|uniref:DUF4337 domain-containing protein n=1 Tax=Verrucomicrobium sp. GAS474 TaxID=1882831 RepID=UPI000879BE4D|nr:DUF4337 domain-containing protein [Verrucomicrobium sp. GAS474]SDT99239.1 protein of unknown function [Verrucomicrobium sp. GAS474]
MSEVEGLTEQAEEHIHHAAHSGPQWASWVALSTVILAVLAALSAFLSGFNETEALINRQLASDQWSYYQAKGLKGNTAKASADLFTLLSKPGPESQESIKNYREEQTRYKEEQEKIKETATEFEHESNAALHNHETYSKGVILFQIAIAVSAVSVLTKRRRYWIVSLVGGAGGLLFLLCGLLQQFGPHLGGHGGH